MCLQTVDEENKATKWKTGYKVVWKQSDGYVPEFNSKHGTARRTYPVGEWVGEQEYRFAGGLGEPLIKANDGVLYPKGFHVFHTLGAITNWVLWDAGIAIIKVAVAEPLASGTQTGAHGPLQAGIFRKIKVLKEVKSDVSA